MKKRQKVIIDLIDQLYHKKSTAHDHLVLKMDKLESFEGRMKVQN